MVSASRDLQGLKRQICPQQRNWLPIHKRPPKVIVGLRKHDQRLRVALGLSFNSFWLKSRVKHSANGATRNLYQRPRRFGQINRRARIELIGGNGLERIPV